MAENVLTVRLEGDPGKDPPKGDATSSVKEVLEALRNKAGTEATYAVKREFPQSTGYQYAKNIIDEAARSPRPRRAMMPDDGDKPPPKRSDWKLGPNGDYIPNAPQTGRLISYTPDKSTLEAQAKERAQQFTTAAVATQNILAGGMGQKAAGAVQLAGSGLLGGRAAAMAGGPIGVAVMAAGIVEEIVSKGLAAPFKAMSAAVRDIGKGAEAVAKNDALGVLTTAASGAAGALDHIPVVGQAAGSALRLVADAAGAFSGVLNALTGRGRELAMYDGRIAQASAMADVRKMLADMREARTRGGEYARLIEAQSRMESRLQQVMDPIKEKLFKIVEDNLPLLETGLTAGVTILGIIADQVSAYLKYIEILVPIGLTLDTVKKDVGSAVSAQKAKDAAAAMGAYDSFDELMKDLAKLDLTPKPPNSSIRDANRALKLPVFGGLR